MAGAVLAMGATGEVGRRVLAGLRARQEPVRGASRDPGRASTRDHGEWVGLDLERPETFATALQGVDRLFLMARPGDDHPDRLAGPLIDAARSAGVRHVVNLTAMGVEREPEFGLRRVELLLESSGLDFTHLRPNFFMQIFAVPPLLPAILATRTIRLPTADARLSFVDTRDIADVAVAAITEGRHRNVAYTLTGPESLDHDDVARHLSAAAGVGIGYQPLSDDEARASLAAAGLGPERVERLIGFYRRVRAGTCAPVSGDVEAVLARRPRSFAAFAADYANCWRAAPAGERESQG